MNSKYYLFIVSVFFVFHLSAKPLFVGKNDSTENFITSEILSLNKDGLIKLMNKEQLNSLVDYFFELDTVPQNLISQINSAIETINSQKEIKPETIFNSSFPATDVYAIWEINKLFSEKDVASLKGDTSLTIELVNNEHHNFTNPFNGAITSNFGWRDSTKHNGIDIDLNRGDKISAAFDGMVRFAKYYGGFGNVVIVRHYNGLETVYAHLSRIKVKTGQVVTAGQLIGLGGSTGHSTGSHLHFEVRYKGIPMNPKYLISFAEDKLICDELVVKKTKWGLAAYPKNVKFYTIEKGDTIAEIAKHFGTTTKSIKEINGFAGKSFRLKAGQTISVAQ